MPTRADRAVEQVDMAATDDVVAGLRPGMPSVAPCCGEVCSFLAYMVLHGVGKASWALTSRPGQQFLRRHLHLLLAMEGPCEPSPVLKAHDECQT